MLFEFNFYSSILLIFFVHGLVYGILFLQRSVHRESNSDKWLGIFLLLCSLYVTPWTVGFAGWYNHQPYRDILFYVPFQHLFLMGPVVYLYVKSLLNPTFKFENKHYIHFIPALLYLLFCGVVASTDLLVLKRYYFLENQSDPDFDSWYQILGFVSMLAYFILALRHYNTYRKLVVQIVSYADKMMFRWVQRFLIAFVIMLCFRLGFYVFQLFVPFSYLYDWYYFTIFAVIMYYIAVAGYANTTESKMKVENEVFNEPFLEKKENDKSLSEEVLSEWKSKLLTELVENQRFEDPELSLSELAQNLTVTPVFLSKIINEGFRQNFNDFINLYRVEAVKKKILAGEAEKITLLGLAYDCGFNSKATFNRAFKKATNLSPKEFMLLPRSNQ